MPSYHYRKSHCGDKTVIRSSYLHNGISYTIKMSSLYWLYIFTLIIAILVRPHLYIESRPRWLAQEQGLFSIPVLARYSYPGIGKICYINNGFSHLLTQKCHHFDNIVSTGCMGCCGNDMLQCSQRWISFIKMVYIQCHWRNCTETLIETGQRAEAMIYFQYMRK